MKPLHALFVLQVTASIMAVPIELASGDVGGTRCNWKSKCFIICRDELDPAVELTSGIRMITASVTPVEKIAVLIRSTGIDMCGIDRTSGVDWAGEMGEICGSTAESFVKRELDLGAHAGWKDELDVGAHVDYNNKADGKAEV